MAKLESPSLVGESQLDRAIELMEAFAARTGLNSGREQQRYLWTDAFAVENYLDLSRVTGDPAFDRLALQLVNAVHRTLGQHRPDDPDRSGWLSGLSPVEGEAHPTLGGLRIGKSLPERQADEPFDDRLEWDRDGQYFHYLTRWMMALQRVSNLRACPVQAAWAVELAQTAHRAFTYRTNGKPQMYWKMSIDLTRPLVTSMGQHDPLDGLVTYLQLQPSHGQLGKAITDFSSMCAGRNMITTDPLGLGGLLLAACGLEKVPGQRELRDEIFACAARGLFFYRAQTDPYLAADRRLPFRELGLAIGLGAVGKLAHCPSEILKYTDLHKRIVTFWLHPDRQEVCSWVEHRDINEVMLVSAVLSGP